MMTNRATESERIRSERISGTNNGSTLRTRVVRDESKYTRKIKHKGKDYEDRP